MNKKGFTLIELLAVIVILAIIALIATPIVLGIINDARENAKKRSAELVYTAVEYAYTNALFNEGNGTVVDDVSLETIDKYLKVENVVRHGFDTSDTEKSVLQIQTKDNVYCKVVKNTSTKTFDVSCGTDETYESTTDVMSVKSIAYDASDAKKRYYSWSPGIIGESLPNDKVTDPLELTTNPGHKIYLGLDTKDGETIDAAYVCFKVSDEQYCLKGGDAGASYEDNKDLLRIAFPGACSFVGSVSECYDTIRVEVRSSGYILLSGDFNGTGVGDCVIGHNGSFRCNNTNINHF